MNSYFQHLLRVVLNRGFLFVKNLKKPIIIAALSVICFLTMKPFFLGSGLSSPQPIGAYLNGNFPNSLYSGNSLYRPAFTNLSFFLPITLNQVPNENKLMVAQLDGKIYWFDNNEQTTTKNLVIDLSDQVAMVRDAGFLGLAFHPEFNAAVNPKNYIYVYYSSKDRNGGALPDDYTYQGCTDDREWGNFLILERYTVNTTALIADENTRTKILVRKMFGETHRGGGLGFGDDGFLYLTTGDQAGWSKSQDIVNNLDGGVLRIDVDKQGGAISHPPIRKLQNHPISGVNYSSSWYTNNGGPNSSGEYSGEAYYIPNDNPFLSPSGDTYEEYYAIGLRSPHRMFKDPLTGIFYVGEVGLSTHEEINVISKGKNYGWPIYEGNDVAPSSSTCTSMYTPDHELPLIEFPRPIANSITGGFVYRGSDIPEFYGKYICADYGTGDEIFSVDLDTGTYEILGSFNPSDIMSFGQDDAGEIYILHAGGDQFYNTTLFKLSQGTPNYASMPQTLSATGAFEVSENGLFEGEFSEMKPTSGVIPFDLIESFWSDGALKKRWLVIPNDGSHDTAAEQIDYSKNGDWDFPIGTVLIKHFDVNIDKNNPNALKKIETRFTVKGADENYYFLTYNWNESQTDATLQQVGLDETIQITDENGSTETQTWHFPSQSECFACHNSASNGGLGLRTRFLNKDFAYNDNGTIKVANQLVTLSHLGIIDEEILDTDTPNFLTSKSIYDTNATLDEKVRSYMDLNCAYCHRPDTDNRASFDLRLFNTLESTGLLSAGVLTPLNNLPPDQKIIYPGDASKSILFHRMNSTDPSIMMPPLAKSLIDTPAIAMIEDWINQLEPSSLTNSPNSIYNLALSPTAVLSGSLDEEAGRGKPLDILYDPYNDNFVDITNYAEYGVSFGQNLGTPAIDDGFYWQVAWPEPKFVNYITFGGSYPNQRQEFTMWRISYLRNGTWHTIEEGQGGWIDNPTGNTFDTNSIYAWGGPNQTPVYAEAIKLQLYSDGNHNLVSIHLRGRGGSTLVRGDDDVDTEPKASLIQFVPFTAQTEITNIAVGNQGPCNSVDNTYTQDLIITHNNAPETGTLIVNGQVFPIENSPQTITLTGLEANGLGVEVNTSFSDGYNSAYKSNGPLFTAAAFCSTMIVGVDEDMVIEGDYEIGSGGTVQVLEGGSLTINGDLTVNGLLELNSTSTKYASLIVNGSSTGDIVYKRHVNDFSNNNDLISTPVKGQTFSEFIDDNTNVFSNPTLSNQKLFGPFNKVTGDYDTYFDNNPTHLNTVLGNAAGYRSARDSSLDGTHGTTFTFTGNVETDDISLPIVESGPFYEKWNLIGNPYPSYLDFGQFFNANKDEFGQNEFQAIYGYDGDSSNGWTIWNNLHSSSKIAPGQGFFVSTKSGGGTVSFLKSMRVSGNDDDFIQGRSESAHLGNFKLRISTVNDVFETDFYFNTNASTGLDPGYDAALFGGSAPEFSLYSHLVEDNNGIPMAIQALGPNELNGVIIPLGIHAPAGSNVTVNISVLNLPDTVNVYLEDNETNTFTLLNDNTYNFTTNSNLTGTGRFYLRVESGTLTTDQNEFNELSIYNDDSTKRLIISGQLETSTNVALYDLKGSELGLFELDNTTTYNTIDVAHLSTGVYIVKLSSRDKPSRIIKLIIR